VLNILTDPDNCHLFMVFPIRLWIFSWKESLLPCYLRMSTWPWSPTCGIESNRNCYLSWKSSSNHLLNKSNWFIKYEQTRYNQEEPEECWSTFFLSIHRPSSMSSLPSLVRLDLLQIMPLPRVEPPNTHPGSLRKGNQTL
jgi:hypothetical protein